MNDTRRRLIEATRRCIGAKGLANTTSRDLTTEAEANLAAITYHFGSKDQLVAEALLDALRAWLEPSLEVLRNDEPSPIRALTAIQTLNSTFVEHCDEAPTYLQAMVESPRMVALQTGVIDLWAELRQLLAEQLRDMKSNGEVGDWIEPEVMASVIIASANGFVLQVTVDPNGPSMEAMTAQFLALLLAARS